MAFKNHEKIALVKLLSDLIKSDGMVNRNEILYLKHIYRLLAINSSVAQSAAGTTLEEALHTLSQMETVNKHAVIRMLCQLSTADNHLSREESLLILTVFITLGITLPDRIVPEARVISIRDREFRMEHNHVLYIEEGYDQDTNRKIREQHEEIRELLYGNDFEFIYIPHLVDSMSRHPELFRQTLRYLEPTLSEEELNRIDENLDHFSTMLFSKELFLNCLNRKGMPRLKPSLLFNIRSGASQTHTDLLQLEIPAVIHPLQLLRSVFDLTTRMSEISLEGLPAEDVKFIESFDRKNADIPERDAEQLRYTGFHKVILDTILKYNKKEGIGRLIVESDGKLILQDKNETEVQMPCLCKALYIFFLIHEEGVRLEDLKYHREEIFCIYKKLSTYKDDKRLRESVKALSDPTGTTLNANLTRIKKAFKSLLGEEANLYIIEGERSGRKKVHLDRQFVRIKCHFDHTAERKSL